MRINVYPSLSTRVRSVNGPGRAHFKRFPALGADVRRLIARRQIYFWRALQEPALRAITRFSIGTCAKSISG
jgi:hypothetical protein